MSNIIKKCPTCNESIDFNKQKLINCRCGTSLILVKIGKNFLVEDVTPDKAVINNDDIN